MSKKPELQRIKELVERKKRLKDEYEQLDKDILELFNEFGEGRHDYDLGEPDDDGKQYMKFVLVDNIKKLQAGENVWTSAGIKPVSFECGMLKGKPKGL